MKINNLAMKTIAGVMTIGFLAAPLCLAFAEGDNYMPTFIRSAADENVKKIADGMTPEAFRFEDALAQKRVDNWNNTMRMVESSYGATPASSNTIAEHAYIKNDNAQQIVNTVAKFAQLAQNFGDVNTPNNYVANTDGSRTISQNGLPVMIQHKPVRDEFGNVSYQDISMKYNGDRLMIYSETTTTDPLGNVSHATWQGTWTPDSKWYATPDTNAYKNILSFVSVETDHTGRTVTTQYQGLQFDGKYTRAFSQAVHDSIYGDTSFTRYHIQYGSSTTDIVSYDEDGLEGDLVYTLHRNDIAYNDRGQLTGYHEEKHITNLDGSITVVTTDAKFTYNEVGNPYSKDIETSTIPNQIALSTVTTTTANPDGSTRTSNETIQYDYASGRLTGATGTNVFTGREADWIEYSDGQGHIVTVERDQGVITAAWYADADGNRVSVSLDQIQSQVKPGQHYQGNITTHYEVVGFTPMAKDTFSTTSYLDQATGLAYRTEESTVLYTNGFVNNTARLLSTFEHNATWYSLADPARAHLSERDITTTYLYDTMGNLTGDGATGTGTGTIFDDPSQSGWHDPRSVDIQVSYILIYGKPLQKKYEETQTEPVS